MARVELLEKVKAGMDEASSSLSVGGRDRTMVLEEEKNSTVQNLEKQM